MAFKEILLAVDQGMAIITLNRPETRNIITSPEIISELEEACRQVNRDMDTNVLIITGADPAFSAGGNIKEMAAEKGIFGGSPEQIVRNYQRRN